MLLQAAFGYGSGIFEQPGLYTKHSRDKPMLDFILAVDSPLQWHTQVKLFGDQSKRIVPVLRPASD